jgi:hypothetical protein
MTRKQKRIRIAVAGVLALPLLMIGENGGENGVRECWRCHWGENGGENGVRARTGSRLQIQELIGHRVSPEKRKELPRASGDLMLLRSTAW